MKHYFLFLLIAASHCLNAQIDIQKFVSYADSISNSGILNSKVPGLVMAFASSDSIYLLKGYGYSNYDKKINVEPEKTLFQIGSIGKIFTSIGLLQQKEKNKIHLDTDVNHYLKDWKIKNPFNEIVTPFHLLTHSAGFNDHYVNYMAKSNSEVESLEVHLKKNMPSLFKAPGTEINYSNYSYALAGHLIEIASGKSFENYIESSIFNPLNMTSATYVVPDDYQDIPLYANGYKSKETFIEEKIFPRHAKPAGSVAATGKDMITFGQALLKRDDVILEDRSFDLLLNQQITNHAKLSGYTLGMEVQNFNGTMAYVKGGHVTGFLSVLVIIPELDLTFFMSTNTDAENHFDDFFNGFKAQFFPISKPKPLTKKYNINEYSGEYSNNRANHENIEAFFQLFRGQITMHKSESGHLIAFHDNAWHEYQYLEKDIFQDLSNSNVYLIFKRAHGKIVSMYRNVNVGGIEIPASFRKLNGLERTRFLNDELPYLLTLMVSYILLPFVWIVIYFVRKKKPDFLKLAIPFHYHAIAFLFLGLFFWNVFGLMIPIIKLGEQMAFGVPESLINMKYINWIMAFSSIVLLLLSINLWIRKKSKVLFRLYYTLFSLISFLYVFLLYRWHFFNVTL